MPERKFSSNNSYRYGFNGKGKDNNNGIVQYDYGFRIYDPRLGRFKSIDPLTSSYPFYTPYQFAGNKPIAAIDLDGLEEFVVIHYKSQKGKTYKTEIRTIKAGELMDQNIKLVYQGNKIGDKVANGNVLVFDVYNEGTKDELYIVDETRNLTNGILTPKEDKLYKEKSKLTKAPKNHKSFVYPSDDEPQYQSDEFDNPQFFIATELAPTLTPKTINGFTTFDGETGRHAGSSWRFGDYSKDGKSVSINDNFTNYLKEIKKSGNVEAITIDINVFAKDQIQLDNYNKANFSNNVKAEFVNYASKTTGVLAKNITVNYNASLGNQADNNVKVEAKQ